MGTEGDCMKKKILVRAPVLTRSGYGEHARFVLRSLRTQEDKFDIYVDPVPWGQCGWIYTDDEERQWLDRLITKTAHYQQQENSQYDISVQVTIPNEWSPVAPVNIGITAGIETNRVAPVWLERANIMDKIITISTHSKNVFLNTVYDAMHKQTGQTLQLKCNTPIEIVHYPVKEYENANFDLKLETDFNFLSVAQWGPRKNMENTIRWFVEEFIDRPAGLIVKTFGRGNSLIDRYDAVSKLSLLLKEYENRKCKVYLLHGDLTDQEMHSLYKHPKIKAFVSMAHGEGFGLPHFEAAYNGMPVIAPEWSGYVDFLCMPQKNTKGKEVIKPQFACVDYDLGPIQQESIWPGVLEENSMWCYPKPGSFKMRLREVYKDYGRFKKQATQLQKWIHKNFKMEDQYEKMVNCIIPEDELELEGWLESLNAEVHG
jgi:glycosyltransferase involved in cell wall biosynthesis